MAKLIYNFLYLLINVSEDKFKVKHDNRRAPYTAPFQKAEEWGCALLHDSFVIVRLLLMLKRIDTSFRRADYESIALSE